MISILFSLALVTNPLQTRDSVTNNLCPVTGMDVRNHQIYRWTLVHGRKYYTFDRQAALKLKNDPDSYLMADGTPMIERPIDRPCRCLSGVRDK